MRLIPRIGWRLSFRRLALSLMVAPVMVQAQYEFVLAVDRDNHGINPNVQPHLSNGVLAFTGRAPEKIYTIGASGTPEILLEPGDPIPGVEDGMLWTVEMLSFDGASYTFIGSDNTFQFGNYFHNANGSVALSGLGSDLGTTTDVVQVSGNNAAWSTAVPAEVHAWRGGTRSMIADTNTVVPGGGPGETFAIFHNVDMSGDTVMFHAQGSNGTIGIYYDLGDGEGLRRLVDSSTMLPGNAGMSPLFYIDTVGPVIDGDDVLFFGEGADGRQGLYISRGFGPLQVFAEKNVGDATTLPDGPYRVDRITSMSISQGNIAIVAFDEPRTSSALYTSENGAMTLHYVIGSGDELDGNVISTVAGGPEMRHGDNLAVGVRSFGGWLAIYWTGPPAQPINAGVNDAWYNTGKAGQGFFIIAFPIIKKMFVSMFTFEAGDPDPGAEATFGVVEHRWFTAFGDYAGNKATLDIEFTSGGVLDAPSPSPVQAPGGTLVIVFASCGEATVTYDIPDLGLQGVIPIQRLAVDNEALCLALNEE